MSLICLFILAACNTSPDIDAASLPEGDVERGDSLFHQSINGTPACVSCHYIDTETLVGPGLEGIAEHAVSRVEGVSAEEYIVDSIVHPANYIVNGFGNLMYAGYSSKLSEQEIADLLAYLLTLEES